MTDKEFYLKIGVLCLRHLLKWPENATRDWEQHHRDHTFRGDIFTTELPTYYVAAYFVPRPHLVPLTRRQMQSIEANIGIMLQHLFNSMLDDSFDWAPVRKQVDDLLRSFGASLQEVIDDNATWIADGMPFLLHHCSLDI